MRAGIYVHIPFCIRKCHYCSFNSISYDKALASRYVQALAAEIGAYGTLAGPSSLYMGGGTPTVLPEDSLLSLIALIFRKFPFPEGAEATLEANPGTLGSLDLREAARLGINRISLGVQSFRPSELLMLGRLHGPDEVKRSVRKIRSAGLSNINLDLIYSLPGQELAGWKENLDRALELDPQHISIYDLSLEEGTLLYSEFKAGRLAKPPEPVQVEMYLLAVETLEKAGFLRYEISNFARPGSESAHNLNYWSGGEYLGFGAGAHSHLSGVRRMNTDNVTGYIQALEKGMSPISKTERLSSSQVRNEFLMLGLRKKDGIDLGEFSGRFGAGITARFRDTLKRLEDAGYLETSGGRLRLTLKGVLASNSVISELF